MLSNSIVLPTKPKIIKDEISHGIFEIDGLYPGYGHTLGNSLRRVILSSISGSSITSLSIDGVKHEFSTIEGVKEDVISVILNLKKTRFKVHSEEPVHLNLKVKGPKIVTAKSINCPSQVEVVNDDQYLFEITSNVEVSMDIVVENGLGYVSREQIQKERADIGNIILDATFTPIRRVSYEVENMRVGNRTDHNRLRISIETDGTVSAKEAFESSIKTMIHQLQSIIGFREFSVEKEEASVETVSAVESSETEDGAKLKIEDAGLSSRTTKVLIENSIKTLGGLARKKAEDLKELEGMGDKGIEEIRETLAKYNLSLKD